MWIFKTHLSWYKASFPCDHSVFIQKFQFHPRQTWLRQTLKWTTEQTKTIYINSNTAIRALLALLDSVQDFPLHAVLQLSPPQHQMEDFVDGMLWILLQKHMKGKKKEEEEEDYSQGSGQTLITETLLMWKFRVPFVDVLSDLLHLICFNLHIHAHKHPGLILHKWNYGVLSEKPSPFCFHWPAWWSPGWCCAQTPESRWRSVSWAASRFGRSFLGLPEKWSPPLLHTKCDWKDVSSRKTPAMHPHQRHTQHHFAVRVVPLVNQINYSI